MSDPFDLGMVSVDDLKGVFSQLVNDLQFIPTHSNRWLDRVVEAKHELIKLCERNAGLFRVVRK
jgi:hypothetical protein